ncbi:Phosphoethanolamine N-methyltransferase-related protein [Tritrichomonas foetus]|uniref:Phosphoethanolamine N-methyltransferase-related protein n=1 Tax=Tritrichomonas foetus TaxID=1144522 RepID=A0A1J4KD73_9EUKA|nr:Phosphoethanolamine N-methyltransferase-related protein [Tritrichomonas foetus]|eukprot:OHT07660.1 Phosphoethanolamine N-methyltransferase-related protein [Tritrichomonas foetus]
MKKKEVIHSKFAFEYSDDEEEEEEKKAPEFGLRECWDNRYSNENGNYDWYFEWPRVAPLLKKYIKSKNETLVIGCGNSTMSADLLKDGFHTVTNIDISPVVIKKMQKIYQNEKKLKWEVMNATALDFFDNTFDVVFDKGTIDAIICHEKGTEMVAQTLTEVHRVLKVDGKFIVITFESPSKRLKIFKLVKLDWKLLPPLNLCAGDDDDTMIYVYIFEKTKHSQND